MRLLMVRSALALGLAIPLLSAGTPANAADAVCHVGASVDETGGLGAGQLAISYFAFHYVLGGTLNQNVDNEPRGVGSVSNFTIQSTNNWTAVAEKNWGSGYLYFAGWHVLKYAC